MYLPTGLDARRGDAWVPMMISNKCKEEIFLNEKKIKIKNKK